jgi:hypothetical protein
MGTTYKTAKWCIGAVLALLVLVAVTDVFIPAERQYYLNARIAGILENLARRTELVTISDSAAWDMVVLVANADEDEVRVEQIDRMADMVLSSDWAIREFAARALGELESSANRSERVIPALRRAVAEQIAALRGYDGTYIPGVGTVYNAQLYALSSITGVPFQELKDHPEQFEQLTPNMGSCRLVHSAAHCDQLLAEWQAEHP